MVIDYEICLCTQFAFKLIVYVCVQRKQVSFVWLFVFEVYNSRNGLIAVLYGGYALAYRDTFHPIAGNISQAERCRQASEERHIFEQQLRIYSRQSQQLNLLTSAHSVRIAHINRRRIFKTHAKVTTSKVFETLGRDYLFLFQAHLWHKTALHSLLYLNHIEHFGRELHSYRNFCLVSDFHRIVFVTREAENQFCVFVVLFLYFEIAVYVGDCSSASLQPINVTARKSFLCIVVKNLSLDSLSCCTESKKTQHRKHKNSFVHNVWFV